MAKFGLVKICSILELLEACVLCEAICKVLGDPVLAQSKSDNAWRLYESEYAPAAYVSKTRQLLDLVGVTN